jgi:hypothetical protein
VSFVLLHSRHSFLGIFQNNKYTMSQAFVREGDDQWLSDIGPSLNALINFLTRENGGIRVYEQKNFMNADGRHVHTMSNGLSYAKDNKGKWEVVLATPRPPEGGGAGAQG